MLSKRVLRSYMQSYPFLHPIFPANQYASWGICCPYLFHQVLTDLPFPFMQEGLAEEYLHAWLFWMKVLLVLEWKSQVIALLQLRPQLSLSSMGSRLEIIDPCIAQILHLAQSFTSIKFWVFLSGIQCTCDYAVIAGYSRRSWTSWKSWYAGIKGKLSWKRQLQLLILCIRMHVWPVLLVLVSLLVNGLAENIELFHFHSFILNHILVNGMGVIWKVDAALSWKPCVSNLAPKHIRTWEALWWCITWEGYCLELQLMVVWDLRRSLVLMLWTKSSMRIPGGRSDSHKYFWGCELCFPFPHGLLPANH